MKQKKYNILYIDDEINNLTVFKSSFYKDFNVFTEISAENGLKIMELHHIHLVITDHKMPGMTGLEFLEIISENYPHTEKIVITAYADVDIIIKAINKCGIYHYILKPWDSRELKITINNAISEYELKQENQKLIRELKAANEMLEQKVQKRTQQLEEANHELEANNQIKDKLFSVISHDLMTPMYSFNVFLDLLLNLKKDLSIAQIKAYSVKIQSYVQNVMELLDNLLNWSLSQMDKVQVKFNPVNLKDIIMKNFGLFLPIAEQKNIRLNTEQISGELAIIGDENMLNIVIRNLISNAIKFTPKNGEILIMHQVKDQEAIISVKDSGIGIQPDHLKRIFQTNHYKSSRGTNNEKGSGLGLQLCREFIQKQNGSIWVESESGKGSTFSFSLPKAD